jgi:hypothetical protein
MSKEAKKEKKKKKRKFPEEPCPKRSFTLNDGKQMNQRSPSRL